MAASDRFTGFRGGLDVVNDHTGTHSYTATHDGAEVMFHVSTELPFVEADPQQVDRKRHLGNDVVIVVFKEGDDPFTPLMIHSQFNHVFVVVEKQALLV